jgi:hypothetical protein
VADELEFTPDTFRNLAGLLDDYDTVVLKLITLLEKLEAEGTWDVCPGPEERRALKAFFSDNGMQEDLRRWADSLEEITHENGRVWEDFDRYGGNEYRFNTKSNDRVFILRGET